MTYIIPALEVLGLLGERIFHTQPLKSGDGPEHAPLLNDRL